MTFQNELNTDSYCGSVADQVVGHHLDSASSWLQIVRQAKGHLNEPEIWHQPDIFGWDFVCLIATIDQLNSHKRGRFTW